MEAYLPRLEPRRHLYELIRDYPARHGRMMRPALCLATTRALGGDLLMALKTAVSIELMHNAFLVHDDIEDDSDERRGRPTLHQMHGMALALNAGDALAVLSLQPLLDNAEVCGPDVAHLVLQEAVRMAKETLEGQAIELGWRADNVLALTSDDYLQMVLKKTCWYSSIFPLRAGAILARRGRILPDHLVRFGFFLGAAFQIQDDLLNLEGNPQRYGKEIDGDLREGKRTLMVIHFLGQAALAERDRVAGILASSRAERSEEDVLWLHRRLEAAGSISYAREVAHGLAGAALHEFDLAFADVPESRERHFLQALPRWIIART
jgi:geranylgeranyl diphosphate synthase type II